MDRAGIFLSKDQNQTLREVLDAGNRAREFLFIRSLSHLLEQQDFDIVVSDELGLGVDSPPPVR